MLRLCLVLLAVLVAAGNAGAQIVRGTVRDAETGVALQGVFVMLLDSATQMRGGVLTDANGFYAIRAARRGTYTLRAERIGQQSTVSPPTVITDSAAATVDLRLPVAAIQLAPLHVSGGNRCIARPRTGERAAQLWEEARKALTVARWVEREKQFQFESRSYMRDLDPVSLHVRRETVRYDVSRNLPYAALDADSLIKHGFVRRDGESFVFYGPDAKTLLSDAFLDEHCFHSVEGTGGTRGMVGLAFRPLLNTKQPDIDGVLWLDAKTLELRFIDYRYTNLPRPYRARGTGGRTDFRRLSNGAWIVSRWYIRMPVVVESAMVRGEYRTAAMQEEGGEVLGIRGAALTLELKRDGTVRGLVYDSVKAEPLANAMVYLSGTAYHSRTDSAGRFQISNVPEGGYVIAFAHSTVDSMPTLPEPAAVDVQPGDTSSVQLAVRPLQHQIAQRCGALHRVGSTAVLFGKLTRPHGAPVTMATVKADEVGYRTGDNGEYVLCGLPMNRALDVVITDANGWVRRERVTIAEVPYRRLDIELKE
jgi:hypothetical protein